MVSGFIVYNETRPKLIAVEQYSTYAAEASSLQWIAERSEVIIKANPVKRMEPFKGKESGGNKRDVISTDTIVEVSEVVRLSPSLEGKIKVGDLIPVRILGGEVDKITFRTGNEDLLPLDQNMLLFLVDGKKEPGLPKTTTDYYSVVGTFSGAFKLTSDGSAQRDKVKDSYKLKDILDTVKTTKLKSF